MNRYAGRGGAWPLLKEWLLPRINSALNKKPRSRRTKLDHLEDRRAHFLSPPGLAQSSKIKRIVIGVARAMLSRLASS